MAKELCCAFARILFVKANGHSQDEDSLHGVTQNESIPNQHETTSPYCSCLVTATTSAIIVLKKVVMG
jgi:hypothetical protein